MWLGHWDLSLGHCFRKPKWVLKNATNLSEGRCKGRAGPVRQRTSAEQTTPEEIRKTSRNKQIIDRRVKLITCRSWQPQRLNASDRWWLWQTDLSIQRAAIAVPRVGLLSESDEQPAIVASWHSDITCWGALRLNFQFHSEQWRIEEAADHLRDKD